MKSGKYTSLNKTGMELQREELDAGILTESYWEIIADRYNDPSVPISFNLVGNIDGVDAGALHPCVRSSSMLKNQFRGPCSLFKIALEKWVRSEQNDPERFTNFLLKNGINLDASLK